MVKNPIRSVEGIKWKCLLKVTKKILTPKVKLKEKIRAPTKEELKGFFTVIGVCFLVFILLFAPPVLWRATGNPLWLLIYLVYILIPFCLEVREQYIYYCVDKPRWEAEYLKQNVKDEKI